MQTYQSKKRPSSIHVQSNVKAEGILPMCTLKQESSLNVDTCQLASPTFDFVVKRRMSDSDDKISAPHKKHIKQENDDSSLWENKEGLLLSRKTSLRNIVSEVVSSFQNNFYEGIPLFDPKEDSDIANATRYLLDEKDTTVLKCGKRKLQSSPQTVQCNAASSEYENGESIMPSTGGHQEARSTFLTGEEVQAEVTKPILRTLKSLNSGANEGFAFDHNFFPKLVGVHSTLSPFTSTEADPLPNLQQTSSSTPLEKFYQDQRTNGVLKRQEHISDVYEVDANAPSPSRETLSGNSHRQSVTNVQSQAQYDLLLTFNQEDGKSDMFLVIKDEVFAVKRLDYRGESYLIHTDSRGKTSILAKAPKEGDSSCQIGRINSSAGHKISFQRGKGTNVPSFSSEHSKHILGENKIMQNPTESRRINSTAMQNVFVNTFNVNAGETVPRNANELQTSYTGTQLPNKQLLSSTNKTRAESSGCIQRSPVEHQGPPAGQQRPPSEAGAERRQVVTNSFPQNSTNGSPFNAHSPQIATNTSSKSWSDQQSILNRDPATSNHLRSDRVIVNCRDQYPNTGTQSVVGYGRQGHLNTETIVSDNYELLSLAERKSTLIANEKRIERRSELLKYITDHLASNEKPAVQPTTNPLVLTGSTNNISETKSKSYDGLNDWLPKNRRLISRCQEMEEFRQRLGSRTPLNQENAEGRLINSRLNEITLSPRYGDERLHPNQPVTQNGSVSRPQPYSNVTDRNVVDPLEGSFQSHGRANENNKILDIIESWKQRQQTIASNSNCQVVRQSLTREHESVNSTQKIAMVGHAQREETVSTNTQVMQQASAATNVTPRISQVSYGVISRSTDGENVRPRKAATALVIDQQGFIYVDATDSVMDVGGRPGGTGQRFSIEGNTVFGLHSNQPGNIAISHPVSSGATGSCWLQEGGRQLSSDINSGQQQFFSSVSQQAASLSTGYSPSDQRLYTYKTLEEKIAPKFDKRCVANNTLNPVYYSFQRSCPITVRPVSSSRQHSYFGEAPASLVANAAKPCAATRERVVAKPRVVSEEKVDDEPCEAAKPWLVAKPCDVIEIVDSPPSADTSGSDDTMALESENKEAEDKVDRGQQSSIEQLQNCIEQLPAVPKPCKAEQQETDDVIEICNPSVNQDPADHEDDEKDNMSAKEETTAKIRGEALRDELIKKIQNTRERIEQERIEWKKARLNKLKAVLLKKLYKLRGITIVDED